MIIEINNSIQLKTEHNLQEVAELIKNNVLEVSKNNLINWKNVWSVVEKKEVEDD